MVKVFGYVVLSAEGQKNLGIGSGPFPIIDLDHHFGVEILDHEKISHWVMKGQYTQLEQNSFENDEKIYETMCGHRRHVHDVQGAIPIVKQLVEVQAMNGNWDVDDYMCGMFNGMELILAVLEGREPAYRTLRKDDIIRESKACSDGPGTSNKKWGDLSL